MGKCGSSCQQCTDEPRPSAKERSIVREPWEEEICDPGNSCKSWEAFASRKTVGRATLQNSDSVHDGTSFLQRKQGWTGGIGGSTGIDQERRLSFRLQLGAGLGLTLSEARSGAAASNNLLVVASVEGTRIFSKTIDGQPGINAGDVIVEVNGRRGTAAELQEVLHSAAASQSRFALRLNLVVRPRCTSFDVTVLRNGPNWQTLGVKVAIDKNQPGCVTVQSVGKEGLVPDWNRSHGSLQIFAGDMICQVNGADGNAETLCRELKHGFKGSQLCFRVMAPSSGKEFAARKLSSSSIDSQSTVDTDLPAWVMAASEFSFDAEAQVLATRRQAEEDARAEAAAQEEEEARLRAKVEEAREALGHGLPQEHRAMVLESVPWDLGCDEEGEVPVPLASPARCVAKPENFTLHAWASPVENVPTPSSRRKMSINSTDSACLRSVSQFAIDEVCHELDSRSRVAGSLSRVHGKNGQVRYGDDSHALSEASTDVSASGTATPSVIITPEAESPGSPVTPLAVW